MNNGEQLKQKYWETARDDGISRDMFDQAVFIFPKDRIENWIEFLTTGATDESKEGRRVKDNAIVREAAKKLAGLCRSGQINGAFPPSLEWSCHNCQSFTKRMKSGSKELSI